MTGKPVVLHVFSTFAVGGPQRRFIDVARATTDRFQHLVIACDGKYDARGLIAAGTKVAFVSPPSRAGSLPARIVRYRRMLNQLRPGLIVTYNWGAIEWAVAAWVASAAHIHVEDGFGPDELHCQLPRRVWFRRLALRKSKAIIIPSKQLETIALSSWLLPAERVHYIPNGVVGVSPISPHERTTLRTELSLPNSTPVAGWVGSLRPEKNVPRLLHAFKFAAVHAHLIIVGDGPERSVAEQEATSLGIAERVHFVGMRSDTQRLMSAFDIFALSSDTEQMPLVVLEAMAAGLPIASFDVGDVHLMVSPENRRYIIAESTDVSLGNAMNELLASPDLRREIGGANRRHAAAMFPLDRMIEGFTDLFAMALAQAITPANRMP